MGFSHRASCITTTSQIVLIDFLLNEIYCHIDEREGKEEVEGVVEGGERGRC